MQTLKDEVREGILAAAMDEFLKKGFSGSSMNAIANSAGISVSNIYNYYPGKEPVFEALTDGVARSLKKLVTDLPSYWKGGGEDCGACAELVPSAIFDFIKRNRLQLILALDRSAGTKRESLKADIVASLAGAMMQNVEGSASRQRGKDGVQPFLVRLLAMNLIQGLLEIAREYEGDAWARSAVKDLMRYHMRGMAGLSG
jgi:AcrR family transcriptional regulator